MKYFYDKQIIMSGLFNYRNGKIHFTDQGKGEVIVLIHGYFETSEVWDRFSMRLASKYRIISPDLPGHGKSDVFGEVHTMEFMAEIINELLDHLKIARVFLVGHSLGGYVTLAFTELFSERLKGYSLFHSHPFADPPETLLNREREINLVNAGGKDDIYPGIVTKMYAAINLGKFSESLERSKEIASTVRGEGITAILKGMMQRPSRVNVMEKGIIPCLWILGKLDNYINCQEIQNKVKLPENAEVAILCNSGHMGFIEEEEESLKAIDTFISRNLKL